MANIVSNMDIDINKTSSSNPDCGLAHIQFEIEKYQKLSHEQKEHPTEPINPAVDINEEMEKLRPAKLQNTIDLGELGIDAEKTGTNIIKKILLNSRVPKPRPQCETASIPEDMFTRKRSFTKVCSGDVKKPKKESPNLASLIQKLLATNTQSPDSPVVGSYESLKPALHFASTFELHRIFHLHPKLALEADEMYMNMVKTEFPNKIDKLPDGSTWREFYDDCQSKKKELDQETLAKMREHALKVRNEHLKNGQALPMPILSAVVAPMIVEAKKEIFGIKKEVAEQQKESFKIRTPNLEALIQKLLTSNTQSPDSPSIGPYNVFKRALQSATSNELRRILYLHPRLALAADELFLDKLKVEFPSKISYLPDGFTWRQFYNDCLDEKMENKDTSVTTKKADSQKKGVDKIPRVKSNAKNKNTANDSGYSSSTPGTSSSRPARAPKKKVAPLMAKVLRFLK